MSAGRYLARSVHLARLETDVVLLDIRQGQYYCLPNAADAFRPGPADSLIVADEDLWTDLRALDLACEVAPSTPSLPPRLGGVDLPRQESRALRVDERWDGVTTYGLMLRRYYCRPFGELVAFARRERRASLGGEAFSDALIERVGAFGQLLPWAPFPGVCLYRSFMLLAFLRRAGLDATWMFGVRTWPFEAHCWLQVGDVVLDDLAERIRPYTPILAV